MGIYQSMQRVRFSSPDGYLKFLLLFGETRNQLKTLPGFLHLTWWVHPKDWHMNTYHKAAKEWAVRSGAIMEDIITNFELKNTRLIRVCPCCALITDKAYDLHHEQQALAERCPKCGFQFPVMAETSDSTAVFKDVDVPVPAPLASTLGD
jgi:hypothetical protein